MPSTEHPSPVPEPHGYHDGQRELQDRFDTRRLADRLAEANSSQISDAHRTFIESRDMFFLATADLDGAPQCSYKGGEPGFVRVLDAHTIAYPVYDGNGMFLSMGNVGVNPKVGILFIDFERGTRLRFNGVASIDDDDPLTDSYPGAQFVVRVRGEAVFANCRRYVHHYELIERSPFVPSGSGDPPVPDWKLDPWFDGTLSKHDPALDPNHHTAPAIPEF
jgi:predicted pyridoxine 5'-phosphate oxidase superfamily flavin-nucleotide-binding protein